MIRRARPAALLLALVAVPYQRSEMTPARVTVVSGSRPDGASTALWLAILRRRLSPAEFDSVAAIRRSRTPAEDAWARLIAAESRTWPAATDSLTGLFDLSPPSEVLVVLGDRGGDDAFTHDSMTVGMDLAVLQRVYGDAAQPVNRDRVNHFFRHEFVHTMQKRWLARHPFVARSFLDAAVLDAWAEGLGNYFSLSNEWRPNGTTPSPAATAALAELEPRLVARIAGLACADSIAGPALLKGLSSGPFTQKWGAVPVALWLLAEQVTDSTALHRFAIAGPAAFWALAERHLPAVRVDSLRDAEHRASQCSG